MFVDVQEIKRYIDESGMKQKYIAGRAGLAESQLCMILQEKRRLGASEYVRICQALDVPFDRFVRQ